jgi:hypothetical protein
MGVFRHCREQAHYQLQQPRLLLVSQLRYQVNDTAWRGFFLFHALYDYTILKWTNIHLSAPQFVILSI